MRVLFYIGIRIVGALLAVLAFIGLLLGFVVAGARPFVEGIERFINHHRPHTAAHA